MSPLEKCLFSSLAYFLIGSFIFLELGCRSCLYIFEINSLSVVLLAIIFSHSFLCCAKAFKFNQVPLIYLCFYFHYSGRWVIEDPAVIYVRECFAYVFSRSFIVSGLTYRSLICFEFIFVYDVKKGSNFILLHLSVQFSQHHLLKRMSFLHCIFLPPLSKIRCP